MGRMIDNDTIASTVLSCIMQLVNALPVSYITFSPYIPQGCLACIEYYVGGNFGHFKPAEAGIAKTSS